MTDNEKEFYVWLRPEGTDIWYIALVDKEDKPLSYATREEAEEDRALLDKNLSALSEQRFFSKVDTKNVN